MGLPVAFGVIQVSGFATDRNPTASPLTPCNDDCMLLCECGKLNFDADIGGEINVLEAYSVSHSQYNISGHKLTQICVFPPR